MTIMQSQNEQRLALFRITAELLASILGLPEGTLLTAVSSQVRFTTHELVFRGTSEGKAVSQAVSHSGLARLLLLPTGSQVLDVSLMLYFHGHDFMVKVSHPGFPAVAESAELPVVCPQYDHDASGSPRFIGWGV